MKDTERPRFNPGKWRNRAPTYGLAVFILILICIRALRQSITIDEADGYLAFSGRDWPAYWNPSSANHVLFAILSHMTTSVFGASAFSVRLPTICGAVAYLFICYRFSKIFFSDRRALQFTFFASLTMNPFVLDYLVAGRGYGLALTFLMASLLIFINYLHSGRSQMDLREVSFASLAVGLSIASNYSFGFVGAISLIVFSIIALRHGSLMQKLTAIGSIVLLPTLVLLAICGPAFVHFTSKELVYGTTSVLATVASVISDTFDGPNPMVSNDLVSPILLAIRPVAMIGLIGIIAAGAFLSLRNRVSNAIALGLAATIIFTLLTHEGFFAFAKVLLPEDRTALYLAPLTFLLIGSLVIEMKGRIFERCALGVLALTALFFAFSLREAYFKEWRFDENVARAYEEIHDRMPIGSRATIASNWRYVSSINFYRNVEDDHSLGEAVNTTDLPVGKDWYVLDPATDEEFIAKNNLKAIYQVANDNAGDIVVLVEPGSKYAP